MKRPLSKGKGSKTPETDEILAEYDFRGAAPNNKYASRYVAGSKVVVLEPDVAVVFPTSAAANNALRTVASLIDKHRTKRPARRSQQRP